MPLPVPGSAREGVEGEGALPSPSVLATSGSLE
jgi:hypothetical protein